MTQMILGDVDNGRRATLQSSLYSGDVGVRERGDALEVAWFGRPPSFRAAVTGTLDGAAIRITGLRSRELTASPNLIQSGAIARAIVVTAELLPSDTAA